MKIRMLALVFVLALFASLSLAQDAETADSDLAGALVQVVPSASLVDNGDETWTLTLNEVSSYSSLVLSSPSFFASNYPLIDIELDWSFAEDLTAEAVIIADEGSFELTLGAPVFNMDENTFSYVVTALVYTPATVDPKAKGPAETPSTINNLSLILNIDNDFLSTFAAARTDRLSSARGGNDKGCLIPGTC